MMTGTAQENAVYQYNQCGIGQIEVPKTQIAWMSTAYGIGLLLFEGMSLIANALRERNAK